MAKPGSFDFHAVGAWKVNSSKTGQLPVIKVHTKFLLVRVTQGFAIAKLHTVPLSA